MAAIRLGILDQSPIISGYTPAQAVHETIRLAQAAERLGFSRYWLAEHHAIAALADPCPEILATRVAAATSTIRVGTGGVLLPYYSPFKIAEQFRMLEALYPGRIDLGIGRAPGGDQMTALAMGEGRYPGRWSTAIRRKATATIGRAATPSSGRSRTRPASAPLALPARSWRAARGRQA